MSRDVVCHPIPPITDPLGKYWRQPDRNRIEVDETHALMTEADFESLSEYSTSIPSGVYPGKMWRRQQVDGWYLVWFGECADPSKCSINFRKALL